MKRALILTCAISLTLPMVSLLPKSSGPQAGARADRIGTLSDLLTPPACAAVPENLPPAMGRALTVTKVGFCDDCEQETNDVYWSWVEATGSACAGLRKSAEFCAQQCPTCKFCSIRIRTFNISCP